VTPKEKSRCRSELVDLVREISFNPQKDIVKVYGSKQCETPLVITDKKEPKMDEE